MLTLFVSSFALTCISQLWSYGVLQIRVILISASKADLKLKKASAEFFYTMFPAQAVQIYDISIFLTTIGSC